MYIPFETLPETSRIWIYQADSLLNKNVKTLIEQDLKNFIEKWDAHRKSVYASFQLLFDRFILIGINDTISRISGCAIDKSVFLLKNLSIKTGMNFLNRQQIAFTKSKTPKEIFTIPFSEIEKNILLENINMDTYMFNNAISVKKSLKTQWLIKVRDSWIKKYFEKTTLPQIGKRNIS